MAFIQLCLFPLWFMFHEMEEIIFFRHWVNKNGVRIQSRYPRISRPLLHFGKVATATFSIAVFEELLLVGIAIYVAIFQQMHCIWVILIGAFTIHLLFHLIGAIILGRYTPGSFTALLSLPYCIYAVIHFGNLFTPIQILFWTFVGLLFSGINLWIAQRIALRIDHYFTTKA